MSQRDDWRDPFNALIASQAMHCSIEKPGCENFDGFN
jgi:hypothetical protein